MGEYMRVLATLKSCPKTFKSNYARDNAGLFAEAASRGHITCIGADGRNQGAWEISCAGLRFLKKMGGAV